MYSGHVREKMKFLDGNEMKPSFSTLNEENEQSEITELALNDVNTCVSESEIASGSDMITDGTSPVNYLDITPPQCISSELICGNISSKKRKLCDEFSTFIKNVIDVKMKKMVNPTIEQNNNSAFAKMIVEELKCLSPSTASIYKKTFV